MFSDRVEVRVVQKGRKNLFKVQYRYLSFPMMILGWYDYREGPGVVTNRGIRRPVRFFYSLKEARERAIKFKLSREPENSEWREVSWNKKDLPRIKDEE